MALLPPCNRQGPDMALLLKPPKGQFHKWEGKTGPSCNREGPDMACNIASDPGPPADPGPCPGPRADPGPCPGPGP